MLLHQKKPPIGRISARQAPILLSKSQANEDIALEGDGASLNNQPILPIDIW